VLIFRPGKEVRSPERPIVVGIDGSEESDRAFTVALELAHVLGATLVAANYWRIAANVGIGLGAGYVDWQKVCADQKQWLTAHVELMHDKYPDVPLSTVSEDGVASRGLRALSSTALMVAVGSRGRGALRGTALGSVSQNLVHHAECSVLIVR
jgi:nucleotide-binding universal stress UspA family protein